MRLLVLLAVVIEFHNNAGVCLTLAVIAGRVIPPFRHNSMCHFGGRDCEKRNNLSFRWKIFRAPNEPERSCRVGSRRRG